MNTSTRLWTSMPIVPWSKLCFLLTAPPLGYATHNSTIVKATQHIMNAHKGICATSAPLTLLTGPDKQLGHFWPIGSQISSLASQAEDAMLLCEI